MANCSGSHPRGLWRGSIFLKRHGIPAFAEMTEEGAGRTEEQTGVTEEETSVTGSGPPLTFPFLLFADLGGS